MKSTQFIIIQNSQISLIVKLLFITPASIIKTSNSKTSGEFYFKE